MARKLKVYARTGYRPEYNDPQAPWKKNTRDIVAAHSAAEAQRLFGCSPSEWRWSGQETGNAADIAQVLTKPGTVFYRGLDARNEAWIEAPPVKPHVPVKRARRQPPPAPAPAHVDGKTLFVVDVRKYVYARDAATAQEIATGGGAGNAYGATVRRVRRASTVEESEFLSRPK